MLSVGGGGNRGFKYTGNLTLTSSISDVSYSGPGGLKL